MDRKTFSGLGVVKHSQKLLCRTAEASFLLQIVRIAKLTLPFGRVPEDHGREHDICIGFGRIKVYHTD